MDKEGEGERKIFADKQKRNSQLNSKLEKGLREGEREEVVGWVCAQSERWIIS